MGISEQFPTCSESLAFSMVSQKLFFPFYYQSKNGNIVVLILSSSTANEQMSVQLDINYI